jgi:hypothetical protein
MWPEELSSQPTAKTPRLWGLVRVGNSGPIRDGRQRPRYRRITPGELSNRQPATDPFRATSRQLRRHSIKVN